MSDMTFQEMCEIDPRLKDLERDILKFRDARRRVKNIDWYHCFKPRLSMLVGFDAKTPMLSSCECYDVAYRHLYDLLQNGRKKSFTSAYEGLSKEQIVDRMAIGAVDGQ
ncbi:MAG TPA: hypothetical protein PKV75_06440 [Desulfobacterales bacterium]|nr:hypothetical protein [Desulfobacterales bacterium]